MSIVNNEENIKRLKDMLASKSNSRLMKMNHKWNEFRESLVEKHNQLQGCLFEKEANLQDKEFRLKHIMTTYEDMLMELKNKMELEKKLVEVHKNAPQNINR